MLETGDYSVIPFAPGSSNPISYGRQISIERKTISDFIGSISVGRDRFLRECARLQELPYKSIIIEGDYKSLYDGTYRSNMHSSSIVGTVIKLMTDFGIPVLFAGTREAAERTCERMLTRHYEKYALNLGVPVAMMVKDFHEVDFERLNILQTVVKCAS